MRVFIMSRAPVILKNSLDKNICSFCPVCDFMISTESDVFSFHKYECCHFCSLKWAESRKESWNSGWRPSQDDIDKIKEERKFIRPIFRKI